MRSLPSNEELERHYKAGRRARLLCWHRYKRSSGMYGDAAVDCVKCSESHYTDSLELFFLRLFCKLIE